MVACGEVAKSGGEQARGPWETTRRVDPCWGVVMRMTAGESKAGLLRTLSS